MIRQDKNIKGYKIKGLDITISHYDDDTSLFLDGSERSLKHCLNALQEFARFSGLKINQGLTFTTDLSSITDRNINKHMNKIRTEIEFWKKRNLYALWKGDTYKRHFYLQN